MSNNDSFIDEVNEAVRRDKFLALMKRYGWVAVVAVILVVGGAGFFEWRKAQAAASAQGFGAALNAALASEDAAARKAALEGIVTQDPEQKLLLDFARAKDDPAVLKALAERSDIPAAYRDLAKFRLTLANPDALDAEALRAAYADLAAPGAPYRVLALEQIALIDLAAGKKDEAMAQFIAIADDVEVTEQVQKRARDMILVLGGDPTTVGLGGAVDSGG